MISTWWASLSWSHATFVLVAILLAIVVLWYAFASLIESATNDPRPRAYPLADYSAAYQRQRDWLGDRWLLARPVNRRLAR
jgi:hypothetical protein